MSSWGKIFLLILILFFDKSLGDIGIKRMYVNIIKVIVDRIVVNVIFNKKSRNERRGFFFFLFRMMFDVLEG